MNPSKNARLIQQFYAACNALANAVNVQLFESLRDPYWVANEIGGLCDISYPTSALRRARTVGGANWQTHLLVVSNW